MAAASAIPGRAGENNYFALNTAEKGTAAAKGGGSAVAAPASGIKSLDEDASGKLVQHRGPSTFLLPDGTTLGDYISSGKHLTAHKFPPGMSGDVYKLEFAAADGKPINYVLKHVNRPKALHYIVPELTMLKAVKGSWFAVQLLAAQLNPDGTAFMLFPFIPGQEFLDILLQLQNKTDPVTKEEQKYLESILRHILNGLLALHSMGIIHRDVKPENIWVPDDKTIRPFLLDFGLSGFSHELLYPAGTAQYIRPTKKSHVRRYPSPNDNYYPISVFMSMLPTVFSPSFDAMRDLLAKNGLTNEELVSRYSATRHKRRGRRTTTRKHRK